MIQVVCCSNVEVPPSKPKEILMIDSEQVPWGKGERRILWDGGVEKTLKLNANNQLKLAK